MTEDLLDILASGPALLKKTPHCQPSCPSSLPGGPEDAIVAKLPAKDDGTRLVGLFLMHLQTGVLELVHSPPVGRLNLRGFGAEYNQVIHVLGVDNLGVRRGPAVPKASSFLEAGSSHQSFMQSLTDKECPRPAHRNHSQPGVHPPTRTSLDFGKIATLSPPAMTRKSVLEIGGADGQLAAGFEFEPAQAVAGGQLHIMRVSEMTVASTSIYDHTKTVQFLGYKKDSNDLPARTVRKINEVGIP